MKNDKPNFIKIEKIADETPCVKTFYFRHALASRPGQFVMLWLPGLDQKPFSVSSDDGETFGLTVCKRGPATEKLFTLGAGDRVGISGPYGTAFSILPGRHYILVAGGYGAAPLAFLAEELNETGSTADFVMGARTAEHLLFEGRLAGVKSVRYHTATDDGSRGHRGYATDLLPDLIDQHSNPFLATCGPELMEKKVLNFANEKNLDCEVSIERHIKCGIGVCGQCAVDPLGIGMCMKGPVVSRSLANQITEFGNYHRDKAGNIVKF